MNVTLFAKRKLSEWEDHHDKYWNYLFLVPALPLISCVTLSKSLSLSEILFNERIKP